MNYSKELARKELARKERAASGDHHKEAGEHVDPVPKAPQIFQEAVPHLRHLPAEEYGHNHERKPNEVVVERIWGLVVQLARFPGEKTERQGGEKTRTCCEEKPGFRCD